MTRITALSRLRPLIFGAGLLAYACSNSEAPAVVASISISPSIVDVPLGDTVRLHVTAHDASSHPISNPSLHFESSDTTVARVSGRGLIIGMGVGTVTITASAGSVNTAAAITVITHPQGTASGTPAVGARPFGIAVSPTDVVLAGRQDLPYLQLTQLPDSSFADSLAVGTDPNDIVFTSSGASAYNTNQGGGTVGIIDVTGKQMTDTVPIASAGYGSPYRIRLGAGDRHYYVSTSTGWVLEYSSTTNTVTQSWQLSGPVNGLAFRPDSTILYATTTFGDLFEITLASGVVRFETLGGTLQDIVVSPNGAELYIADEQGEIEVLNAATGAAITTVGAAADAFGLTLSRDGKQLYATVPAGGVVLVIDPPSRSVINGITVGGTPRRIAFNRLGTEALITNEAGFISVIK